METKDFSDLLHIPTREERLAKFRSKGKQKHTGWVNIYDRYGNTLVDSTIYDSKDEAIAHSDESTYATIKIEWRQ